jgi:DNA polymerase/3'-5' exonuclease PolX
VDVPRDTDILVTVDDPTAFVRAAPAVLVVPPYAPRAGLPDVRVTDPINRGAGLVYLTGPTEFNIALYRRGLTFGLRIDADQEPLGIAREHPSIVARWFMGGRLVPTPDEHAVFDLLQLGFIPPEQRHDPKVLQRV